MSDDCFEIRVAGILPPEALLDYEDLTVTVRPAETVLDGRLPDQAALNGLLARLEIYGARVILVRRHLPATLRRGSAGDQRESTHAGVGAAGGPPAARPPPSP